MLVPAVEYVAGHWLSVTVIRFGTRQNWLTVRLTFVELFARIWFSVRGTFFDEGSKQKLTILEVLKISEHLISLFYTHSSYVELRSCLFVGPAREFFTHMETSPLR